MGDSSYSQTIKPSLMMEVRNVPTTHCGLSATQEKHLARRRRQQTGTLRIEGVSWVHRYREYTKEGPKQRVVTIGPATGKDKLTEKQAQRIAQPNLDKANETAIRPSSSMTLAQFYKLHFKPQATINLKKSTHEVYFSLFKNWVDPIIGDVKIQDIDAMVVESVIANIILKGKSTKTASHVTKLISAIWTLALKYKVTKDANPALLATMPEQRRKRPKVSLNTTQLQTVLSLLEEPVRTMAYMAVVTSCNIAELCGLRWEHINLTNDWAMIEGEAVPAFCVAIREHFSRSQFGTLKTGSRRRNVALVPDLIDALQALKIETKFQNPTDTVFACRSGRPLNGNNIQKRILAPMAQTIKVSSLGWHTFRHTHATLMRTKTDVKPEELRNLLGHSRVTTTDLYGEQDANRQRDAINQIAAVIDFKKIAAADKETIQ